jgi:hypothetical protein
MNLEERYRLVVNKKNRYRYKTYVQGEGYGSRGQQPTMHLIRKYKDFQHLPICIADIVDNKKQSVKPLRSLLIEQSFYSIDEFLDYCDSNVVAML